MQGMVGFRNIAVHDYREIDEDILKDVIENHLTDLLDFARIILELVIEFISDTPDCQYVFRRVWIRFYLFSQFSDKGHNVAVI